MPIGGSAPRMLKDGSPMSSGVEIGNSVPTVKVPRTNPDYYALQINTNAFITRCALTTGPRIRTVRGGTICLLQPREHLRQ